MTKSFLFAGLTMLTFACGAAVDPAPQQEPAPAASSVQAQSPPPAASNQQAASKDEPEPYDCGACIQSYLYADVDFAEAWDICNCGPTPLGCDNSKLRPRNPSIPRSLDR